MSVKHIFEKISDQFCFSSSRKLEKIFCELSSVIHTADIEQFLKLVDLKKHIVLELVKKQYRDVDFANLITLKIINLIVAKYHFIHKHTILSSHPFHFLIDTSNSCQLHCPGCIHTLNEAWKKDKDWPSKFIDTNDYETFMEMFGPFAFGGLFYNYGEPLLNRKLSEYIKFAQKYLIHTEISSNLSLPEIDAEGIILSGLDRMFLSIDGVTQDVYGKFRRGGNIDWVLKNLKNLVETRNRLGSEKPYLVWLFLTFQHNIHELDKAMQLAKEIGVDAIEIRAPFDVSGDDPFFKIAHSKKQGLHVFNPAPKNKSYLQEDRAFELARGSKIDRYMAESYYERMVELGGLEQRDFTGMKTCGFLYKNITMDAVGRMIPCCGAPSKTSRHLAFGQLHDSSEDYVHFNSSDMQSSRLFFGSQVKFNQIMAGKNPMSITHCRDCGKMLEPEHDLDKIALQIQSLDTQNLIRKEALQVITDW